jgi:hypothetical protein
MKTLVEFAANYLSNQADRRGHLTEAKTSHPSLRLDHPAWEDVMPGENNFHPNLIDMANKMKSLKGHKLKYSQKGKRGSVSMYTPSGEHMGTFSFGGYDNTDDEGELVDSVNRIVRKHYGK